MPDLTLPLFADDAIPYQGKTADARAAGRSGAALAIESRAEKTRKYLELLKFHGPFTDQDAAKRLNLPLASINSIRGGMISRAAKAKQIPPIVAAGTVKVSFGHQRFTYRTLWRLS